MHPDELVFEPSVARAVIGLYGPVKGAPIRVRDHKGHVLIAVEGDYVLRVVGEGPLILVVSEAVAAGLGFHAVPEGYVPGEVRSDVLGPDAAAVGDLYIRKATMDPGGTQVVAAEPFENAGLFPAGSAFAPDPFPDPENAPDGDDFFR